MTDQQMSQLDIDDPIVASHIMARATVRNGRAWLPAVYSEHDEELRARIAAELGDPVASGYMSEECGWKLGKIEEDL